jgi:alginate O-acetyltransferase complex protein AlgI
MVFSTSIFLFFFLPLVIAGYHLLKENYRLYFLLSASLFFYAWGEPRYIFVMLLSITVNYVSGLLIHLYRSRITLAKFFLIFSIACSLGILFYFKYLNFTLDTINGFFNTSFVYHKIVLPIGISFFIFQGMSYVIDLYRRQVDVQKNPFKLAFYISFFPQLMAGPIIRYIDIKDQIYKREESVEVFVDGAKRFIIGLAKKVIIANNMGYVADMVFANPAVENTAAIAWLGVICYTFQIYFDFSGYSDMAIGLAKLFGFQFRENFNYPYISKTITEFWRRWHISLSSWFRDYVYIPLGGNRKGNVYVNLFIVFVLTGFWHGASFSFLIWGLWHGFSLIIERLFDMREAKNKKIIPLRYALTMLIVVTGWVFFRSPDLRYALGYLGIMFGLVQPENAGFTIWYYLNQKIIILLCLAVIASTPVLKLASNFVSTRVRNTVPLKIAGSVLILVLCFISVMLVTASSYNPFIYFRF